MPDLVTDLYRRMPDARITDILLEVDDATRFTEAFTHLRTGSPCRDRIGLLNVLLAARDTAGQMLYEIGDPGVQHSIACW